MILRFLKIMTLAILTITISSCKTETTDRKDYKEVMRVHDEAMARMGEIYELKRQIQELKEELTDTIMVELSEKLISSLDEADEGMMNWMAKFRIPEDKGDVQIKSYFIEEQKKVDIVNKDIAESIAEAKKFVEKHKVN